MAMKWVVQMVAPPTNPDRNSQLNFWNPWVRRTLEKSRTVSSEPSRQITVAKIRCGQMCSAAIQVRRRGIGETRLRFGLHNRADILYYLISGEIRPYS